MSAESAPGPEGFPGLPVPPSGQSDPPVPSRAAGPGPSSEASGGTDGETSGAGPLLGPGDIRELAAAIGLRPTKQRGQNFVTDGNTVRRIVRTAGVRPSDVVVEIGPGLGSLTLALLQTAQRVTAVEVDEALAASLPATVRNRLPERAERFSLVREDALRVTELPGPPPSALVANLPYNVAVPVLLHMLATFPSVERGLVMVQSEVADRLAARPGSKVYGVPSVKAAWYCEVKRAGAVGRSVFWPAPNVDSGLVSLVRRESPPATRASREEVFAVVDAAFAQRRKTLRAALAGWAGSAEAARTALAAAGVDPRSRGESLTVEEFAAIAEHRPGGTPEAAAPEPDATGPDATGPDADADGARPGSSAPPAAPSASGPSEPSEPSEPAQQ